MARPTNKYERLQAGKRRLERLYDHGVNDGYPCGVEFIIKNDDCGETLYDEYKDCYGCKYRCIYDRNKSRYITWERPVGSNYTIIKCCPSKHSGQVSCTTFYKRYTNKVLRKKKELYQGNQYRKVFDYWWTLY